MNNSETAIDEGIIQLQDLRLSPIPSLRKRNNTSLSHGGHIRSVVGPPSLRFIRRHHYQCSNKYVPHVPSRRSQQQRSPVATVRQSSGGNRSVKDQLLCGLYSLPKIKDVNLIDKYSRFVFPAAFAIFNAAYWTIYILL